MAEIQNTRENLLSATIEVIDLHGVKGVRVRDIAARAGVKEPSVYHYFGSRDGLIEEAQAQRYSRGLLELTHAFASHVRSCASVDEFQCAIRQVFAAIVKPEREEVRAVRANVLGSAMSRPRLKVAVAQAQGEAHKVLSGAIAFAQQQGWVRPELDTMAFAVWYTGMVNGRLVYEIDPGQCDPAAWDAIGVEVTLHLLRQK
ncbi:TetR/AcrR family transcriptional regulator [Aurantimicrobium minutum]|uniref:TetR/AcrR family transcriptional regulator n=1 Tax=Aurantimicrobium minutum TaxID=708131 RepID=UPI0024732AC3|nr:TetR/AcrR family transcriptional regulator [Aurantimicrobium minutum]MDH6422491.1 AcrR family transcriptional regulator [Aurantimicrobium minutum]